MPVHFQKPTPHIVKVDGESIRLHFKRMTVPEFEAFSAVFSASGTGRGEPVPKAQDDCSADEWQSHMVERQAFARAHADWFLEVFDAYVTVEPGDLTFDGELVTGGRRFVEVMVGQDAVLIDALGALWLEHKLTPLEKKTWRLRRGSETGSPTAPSTETSGKPPGTAAESAAHETSVNGAAVSGLPSDTSSGTTAPPRSSGPARSASSRRRRIPRSASSTGATRPSLSGSAV